MALASCSLSLLIQVHEAAAVVASGGDAGAEWRPIGYLSPYWSALPLPLAYARLGLVLPGVWGRSDGYS